MGRRSKLGLAVAAFSAGLIWTCTHGADGESTGLGPGKGSDTVVTTFTCQGKTTCGQMESCAEATYYLEHCPDVQLDGDGDGIPCEDQWCGH